MISNNLTQLVNFPNWITEFDSHSPTLLDLIISSDASIYSTMASPPLGNSDHWDALLDHLRYVPWEDIFKLSASAAANEFCEWVQVGIDVYIPHRKYQVKPHSSPWFSDAFAADIVHRNHYFKLYQQNKSSESKNKFRQAINCCERIPEVAKLAYACIRKRVHHFTETSHTHNIW